MFSKTLKTTYLQTLFYSFLNILLKQKVEKRNSSTEFLEDLHIQSIAISKIYKEAKRYNNDITILYYMILVTEVPEIRHMLYMVMYT